MISRNFATSWLIPLIGLIVVIASVPQRHLTGTLRAEEAKSKAKAKSDPAPSQPVRTETITYDAWTVSCRDTADGKTKKVCSATLPMVMAQQNQAVPLGAWIIGRNNEGGLVSVVQTPQINVGVMVSKGIELKLGNANPHSISYSACNPQRCEGILTMNEAVTRSMIAASNDPAVITFWKADGDKFAITIQSIKGIDKAISAIR